MTGPQWDVQTAIDRWLDDLESGEAVRGVSETRLGERSTAASDERLAAYLAAARRWLDRDQPEVALRLLARSEGEVGLAAATPALGRRPSDLEVQLRVLGSGAVGTAGLPVLTEEEWTSLRAAEDPEAALAVLRRARLRLELHGEEARKLLARWLDRRDHER